MLITTDVRIFPAVDSVTASRHCVMSMCVPLTEAGAALGEIDVHATRHKLCFSTNCDASLLLLLLLPQLGSFV